MRKTKIVCTLGPATDNEDVLRKLMLAGMNVARLNFSHGTHEEQKKPPSSPSATTIRYVSPASIASV